MVCKGTSLVYFHKKYWCNEIRQNLMGKRRIYRVIGRKEVEVSFFLVGGGGDLKGGMVLQRHILKQQAVTVTTGFNWLKIGSSSRFL